MSRPPAIVRHDTAGWLEPVRVGVRWVEGGRPIFGEVRLAPGALAVGPWRLALALDAAGEVATLDVVASSAAPRPLALEAVVLGFRWRGIDTGHLRFLRHGWQSWSVTEGRALDAAGEPAFPSGPWLRGMWHALGEPPADRAGWHESDLLTAVTAGDRAALVAGALERGRAFGVAYLRPESDGVRVELELRFEVPVAPEESREGERVRVALGADVERLLEEHAAEHGRTADARAAARFRTGWCTWYHFFHGVTEDDVLRNLDALAAARDEIPVDVVQIDDGYQRAIGDWLETSEKFPRGLAPLAAEIRAAGFEAGLWTAPFCVVPESRLFAEHPEWLLRDGDVLFRGLLHPMWSKDGSVHVLDASLAPVTDHLERTFRSLVEMGFSYQKLDFLYAEAMRAEAADPRLTRAERLRRGLEAIRTGCGRDAFLLGCGCPLGPAVGIADGMRIGPDVAPYWEPRMDIPIPGLEPTAPSTRNALRNVLHRVWMHRRLWLNDPDCLMARSRDTGLSADEARTLAVAVGATGGMAIFSDDVPELSADDRRLVAETLELAREVDGGGAAGTAQVIGLLDEGGPRGVAARTLAGGVLAAINLSDAAARCEVAPGELVLPPGGRDAALRVDLAPHASQVVRLRGASQLAVFCDMDGTFIAQDVGSTLARRYAADRRPAAWARFERGEITAWEYNLEIVNGLAIPEQELEAFLQGVELDPGAAELVAWCEKHGAEFRVLSDGFDLNIDRLQEIHGVHFAYDANHLHYEAGRWAIASTHPNPRCACGTGVCKAGRIDAWRADHPDGIVVHVGNGRVSDLCGALAANVAFAKDSLAEELARLGERFEPFETLHDVVAGLERLWRDHSIGS
jgi:alpha-galactosidase